MKPMTLTVPAGQDWIMVLRLAASGVGAVYDLPVDVLEDLGAAVEESCELLLHQDYAAEQWTLQCEARPDGLHVTLLARERSPRREQEAADPDIARLIIQTLVKDVSLEGDGTGVHCVRMTLPAEQ